MLWNVKWLFCMFLIWQMLTKLLPKSEMWLTTFGALKSLMNWKIWCPTKMLTMLSLRNAFCTEIVTMLSLCIVKLSRFVLKLWMLALCLFTKWWPTTEIVIMLSLRAIKINISWMLSLGWILSWASSKQVWAQLNISAA